MNWFYKKRTMSFLAMLLFVVTGTYNAIVITSESHLNGADIRFVKRLDEMKGIIEPGRLVATGVQWQKLAPTPVAMKNLRQIPVVQEVRTVVSSSQTVAEPSAPAAAVTEELNLNLVEVINPKKWQNGLPLDQFSGSLSTSNGTIDSLNVALPNGEGVTVSFSEMNGNVFEYDLEGEVYSGMLYQVDKSSYMVTLTNGPLEGTRLRFIGEPSQEQLQESQNQLLGNTEMDNFGNPGEVAQAEEAQPVNFEAPQPVDPQMDPNFQAMGQDPDAQFQQQGLENFQNNG